MINGIVVSCEVMLGGRAKNVEPTRPQPYTPVSVSRGLNQEHSYGPPN